MKKLITLLTLLTLSLNYANNLTVSNVTLTGQNIADDYTMVQFDISWENSWRNSINYDAAWIFIKYQLNGVWYHATLNTTGNSVPSGSTIDVVPDGVGAFIYRDADGTGTFNKTGVELRWNYGENGLTDNDNVNLKVLAIEMVYVPTGGFYVGDGSTIDPFFLFLNWFHDGDDNTEPFYVDGSQIVFGQSDGQLNASAKSLAATGTTLQTDFPTGYNAFYCMKYEATQSQYVDFLNLLTREQQATHSTTDISPGITNPDYLFILHKSPEIFRRNSIRCDATIDANAPITFYCDYNENGVGNEIDDGLNIPCNFIDWGDLAAYADWAGLRPLTELEYEKACRGNQKPVPQEYAWGTTNIATSLYSLSNIGATNESITANYSTTKGNCGSSSATPIAGPLRTGIFAANLGNTGRVSSGASYYGIMELSGNLYELIVSLGNYLDFGTGFGQGYTGLHGNGSLASDGNANVTNWPYKDAGVSNVKANGVGCRGGSFFLDKDFNYVLQVSVRRDCLMNPYNRSQGQFCGIRLVRTAQ